MLKASLRPYKAAVAQTASVIGDPLGCVLAGPNFEGETILYAEIDPQAVIRGKFDFDVAGHYARPDVFQLSVDDRPKKAVSTLATPAKPSAGAHRSQDIA